MIALAVIGFAAQGYAAEPNKGMALYRGHCAACHGIDGGGNGPKATGLTPPPTNFRSRMIMNAMPDSQLERTILAGKPGTAMKGYGTIFSGQDVAALVKYLRSLATIP
jgi:cytochrome c oxidase cbb3-type subunit 2